MIVYISSEYKKIKLGDRKFVNDFEILEEVGEGSFWRVFRVKRNYQDDSITDTNFYVFKEGCLSLKDDWSMFDNEEDDNNELKEFFEEKRIAMKELMILQKLNYKHIARLYECIIEDTMDKIVFVMEICDLGSLMVKNDTEDQFLYNYHILNFLLQSNSYTENQEKLELAILLPLAKKIFKQLAFALNYLHQRCIAHRDINPNNILLKSENEGTVKLTDFSISKIFTSRKVTTKNAQITPVFEPPEMSEETHNPFKVDIYCFGATMYIYLFNNFEFKTLDQKLLTEIDESLANLLASLLNPNPEERPEIESIILHKFFE